MKKISAKRLRDMLEQVVVHNDHGLFRHVKPVPPVLSFTKRDRLWSACWRVWRPGLRVDPNAHWHDHGAKTFLVGSAQEKAEQFETARNWASEKYGYTTDWVKTPFGSWVPKDALDAALRHYLPDLFEETVYVPPTVLPDMRPLDEVIKKIPSHGDVLRIEGLSSVEDSNVRQAALDAYSEVWIPSKGLTRDHERGMRAALQAAVPIAHAHLNACKSSTGVDDDTDGTSHWYEVRGAGVTVLVRAIDETDAETRVKRLINRMTMDCSLELHITRRDSEVD